MPLRLDGVSAISRLRISHLLAWTFCSCCWLAVAQPSTLPVATIPWQLSVLSLWRAVSNGLALVAAFVLFRQMQRTSLRDVLRCGGHSLLLVIFVSQMVQLPQAILLRFGIPVGWGAGPQQLFSRFHLAMVALVPLIAYGVAIAYSPPGRWRRLVVVAALLHCCSTVLTLIVLWVIGFTPASLTMIHQLTSGLSLATLAYLGWVLYQDYAAGNILVACTSSWPHWAGVALFSIDQVIVTTWRLWATWGLP